MQQELVKAIEVLKAGGVILYPTDTVWGLGCDATNKESVDKIFKIKQRSESKSLVVLAANEAMLNRYVPVVPEAAWNLIEVTDKPLTIVYPGVKGIAVNAVAEDGSVGIRIPQDDFCNKLIFKFNKPIVSTSANISGQPFPQSFRDINPAILEAVDHVVNLRQDEISNAQPSSIIKVGLGNEITIIRK